MTKQEILASVKQRKDVCWQMAQAFIDNRDSHGVMDIGAELEALERAEKELEKLDA